MAPIRRYLRITKYSVLEVRIYLPKPSDVSWLLSSRDNVLQRIIQEVRPKVLPKLREENENAKRKGSKKKRGIKDVASQEDFEVSIFLKETNTRHSLLTKRKSFANKERLKSNGKGLTSWLGDGGKRDNAIRIDEDEDVPAVLREEDDDVVELKDIPPVDVPETGSKRKSEALQEPEDGEDADDGFVSSSDDEFFATQRASSSKKRKQQSDSGDEEDDSGVAATERDDKKKMLLETAYDGFSIYGRILCLIVTRKGKKEKTSAGTAPVGGSQMMEQWIGTQAAQEAGLLDDDEG